MDVMESEILGILANIKKKYSSISTSHKNQCPHHFKYVATLELVASEIRGEVRHSRKFEPLRDGKDKVDKQDHLTYSNLFMKQHDGDKQDRKVLVIGEAGIGKTLSLIHI